MGSKMVQKVLQLAERGGFLLPVSGDGLQLGPAGQLFKVNVSQEWFQSTVVDAQDNVFPIDRQFQQQDDWQGTGSHLVAPKIVTRVSAGFKAAFQQASRMSDMSLPFGVAEIRPCVTPKTLLQPADSELAALTPHRSNIARTRKFEKPGAANQLFDHWQRQRKIWWRKVSKFVRYTLCSVRDAGLFQFSNSPGRIKVESTGQGCVSVVMNLPELPPLTVETVEQLGTQPFAELPREVQTAFEVSQHMAVVQKVTNSIDARNRNFLYTFGASFFFCCIIVSV